jgi:hypothetical protein
MFGLATTSQLWALWYNKQFGMVKRERGFHITMIASILGVLLIFGDLYVILERYMEGPQNVSKAMRTKMAATVCGMCCVSVVVFMGVIFGFLAAGFSKNERAYPAWVLVDFIGMSMFVLCLLCCTLHYCSDDGAEMDAEPKDPQLPTQQQQSQPFLRAQERAQMESYV